MHDSDTPLDESIAAIGQTLRRRFARAPGEAAPDRIMTALEALRRQETSPSTATWPAPAGTLHWGRQMAGE